MGFFDLANPLLDTMDGWMAALPATARLAIWAAVGAIVSMGLYRLTSRQERMAELKPQIREAQAALANFDGELTDVWPLMRRQLGLNFRQLGLAIGPALLASIPLLFVLVWLSNRYDVVEPAAGETIAITTSTAAALSAPGLTGSDTEYTLVWPSDTIEISDDGTMLFAVDPGATLAPIVHKKQWYNALIGNPMGYLPEDSALELVTMEVKTAEYLSFGPGWMRGWEMLFLSLLFAFSLAIKFVWKIH